MHTPLLFSFWYTVAAYVVHCIDESLLGGSFVEKLRQHWWLEYSWKKFFWFNAAYLAVMIPSVILYDFRGGAWMILPLAQVIERACNGVWHVGWAVRFHEYSPGGFEHSDANAFLFRGAIPSGGRTILSAMWIPALVIGGALQHFWSCTFHL